MKIKGLPVGTMGRNEVLAALEMRRQNFINTGLSEFLDYHETGKTRLYLSESVSQFKYWRFVQTGLAALGLVPPSPPAPLLPPGETYEAKRVFLDAWFEEDANGTECPQCEGPAVTDDLQWAIWCPECGVLDENQDAIDPDTGEFYEEGASGNDKEEKEIPW